MSGKSVINSSSRVVMHYRIVLQDGTVADESFSGDPFQWCIGDGSLDGGLEQLVIGMQQGEHEEFLVAPGEAFGTRDGDNLHRLPRSQFDDSMELSTGLVIGFSTPAGEELAGIIVEFDDQNVEVDFSHPLAGRTLRFEVEILGVEAESATS